MRKSLPWIIIVGLAFLGGIGLARYYFMKLDPVTTVQSDVVLEKVNEVFKLISVEGNFSEIYSYKEHLGFDVSFFRKKAIVKVNATVAVGFDLSKASIRTDNNKKIVYIDSLPPPEILSIDPELEYYDITEGTFNSFSAADMTRINKEAKAFIRDKAQQAPLMNSADRQLQKSLALLQSLLGETGWKLVVETQPVLLN